MDSGDGRSSTAGVGSDWTLIPDPASALIDTLAGQLGDVWLIIDEQDVDAHTGPPRAAVACNAAAVS